jgi:8-oxo-dGTP pyrophosphatase MutT (NUDIX family)
MPLHKHKKSATITRQPLSPPRDFGSEEHTMEIALSNHGITINPAYRTIVIPQDYAEMPLVDWGKFRELMVPPECIGALQYTMARMEAQAEGILEIPYAVRFGTSVLITTSDGMEMPMFQLSANHPTRAGQLSIPGGHYQPGVTIPQSAMNELTEELGVLVKDRLWSWDNGSQQLDNAIDWAKQNDLLLEPRKMALRPLELKENWLITVGNAEPFYALVTWEPDTAGMEFILPYQMVEELPSGAVFVDLERFNPDTKPKEWAGRQVVSTGHNSHPLTSKAVTCLEAVGPLGWRQG